MANILHLDDDPVMLMKTRSALSQEGARYNYTSSKSVQEFWAKFSDATVDCVILDVVINGDENGGVNVLRSLRGQGFKKPVLMMSSVADTGIIRACVSNDATDFLTKGADEAELLYRISNAIGRQAQVDKEAREILSRFSGETMRRIFLKMPRIVGSSVRSVLVNGESGTGKEVVAECLKAALPHNTPFVPVNCAAISAELLESELFGHEKGAFTGATNAKSGLFAAAHGGWIFLDEVARLSQASQAALLRTLESGEIRPVGSSSAKIVDVRVLAATNEDLDEMVARKEFRGDLLQRLRSYEVMLPPLRERADEIPEILEALLDRLSKQSKKSYKLAPAVQRLFLSHSWKAGNVREMWQVLQAASVDAVEGTITVACLPRSFVESGAAAPAPKPQKTSVEKVVEETSSTEKKPQFAFPISLPDLEEKIFLDALEALFLQAPHLATSQRKASECLGISRHTLSARLERIAAKQALPAAYHHLLGGKKEDE